MSPPRYSGTVRESGWANLEGCTLRPQYELTVTGRQDLAEALGLSARLLSDRDAPWPASARAETIDRHVCIAYAIAAVSSTVGC
ncbi:hypothetical protein AYO39_01580 [Actinobacteria bacterium SCGC AG-212-D09]|nr:hypothetical protein AYO39_01580 [Actinobacteria bacterium SCGC AG-212-D09]